MSEGVHSAETYIEIGMDEWKDRNRKFNIDINVNIKGHFTATILSKSVALK